MILIFLYALLVPALSFASIGLSVNPVDGSSSLRLEQAFLGLDSKKDVRVRVMSTDGQRYQVFARLLEPMVNEKGISLDLQAISLATVSSSNTSGTLYSQNPQHLTMGEQLLYSSGQNGEGDAFSISYVLNPELVSAGGNYSGRIIYTVRSAQGGDSQATLNFNVQAMARWSATVGGSKSNDRISINDKDLTELTSDFAKIMFAGNDGQDVRIYQEFVMMPQGSDGREIGIDGLIFYVSGEAEGNKAQSVRPLNENRSLIYDGRVAQANLAVYYQFNPQKLGDQAPGEYSGRIKFTIESEYGVEDHYLDVKCTIQPIFTIDVMVPVDGISFNRVNANNPAQIQEVTISVHTNLKRPYQVTQNLQALMTNDKGGQIAKEYFTQKIEMQVGFKGRSKYMDFLPVEPNDVVVFESDNKGSPSTFKIYFKLQGYQGMSAGNFNAPIQFSLNQN